VADPETLDSFEVGYKVAAPTARLDLSAFYYNYKDLQQQFFQGLVTVIGNAANARLYGLEFDGTVEPADGFQLRLAGSWVPHAEYKSFPTAIGFATPLTAAGLSQVQVDLSGERML